MVIHIHIHYAVFGALETVVLVIGWWYRLRDRKVPKSIEEGYQMLLSQFRRFTYGELKEWQATSKEEIGRGSSGAVYRGVLDDKRVVAVKKLNDVIQEEEEFWAEVNMMAVSTTWIWLECSVYALNVEIDFLFTNTWTISRLTSFFLEMTFHFNGDRGSNCIGCRQRARVSPPWVLEWIIHCDVKPENILLTRDFERRLQILDLLSYLREVDRVLILTYERYDGLHGSRMGTTSTHNIKSRCYSYGVCY